MDERTDVLVRIPTELLRKIEQRAIAAKKAKFTWSRNDEIVSMLELAAAKTRAAR